MPGALRWALAAIAVLLTPVAAAHAGQLEYGIESTSATLSTAQAGAHPDLVVRVNLKTDPETGAAYAGTRDVSVDLPPGLIAAPSRFPTCPLDSFLAIARFGESAPCPIESQVGLVNLNLHIVSGNATIPEALYNLPPGDGAVARFGFLAGPMPRILEFRVGPGDGYRLHAELRGLSDLFLMNSAEAVVWGVPSDPSHDALRLTPYESSYCDFPCQAPGGERPSEFPPIPLMTNPTWCGPSRVGFELTSYALPGESFGDAADVAPIGGCGSVPFTPSATLAVTADAADWSTGLRFGLTMPASGFEDADTLVGSALRRLVLSLPSGYSLNPAAATNLGSCSGSQVGLLEADPPRFDDRPAACPAVSELAGVSIETPMLADGLQGRVYLATPRSDPDRSVVPLYLIAEGDGILVKLLGRLVLDPGSGQVEARFDDLPPLPISSLSLDFGAGERGLLTTPATCGSHRGEVDLDAWSGAVTKQSISLETRDEPGGAPCDPLPFSPRLVAGTTAAVAGAPSPFVLRIDRAPGERHLRRFEVRLPKGLVPDLSAVGRCGADAASVGACPASSRVGSVSILAGAGPSPLPMPAPGAPSAPVYLGGPEAGAPLSLVAVVPAKAGPFDLGDFIVHAPVSVDPVTARVTVRGELPQILDGVPIHYRRLRLKLDRPGFLRNPTSCAPSRIGATLTAVDGTKVSPSTGFRVGSCGRLGFRPRLLLGLHGALGKGGHPAIGIHLRMPDGSESISRLSVLLPATELLDMRHVQDVCSRQDFARGTCLRGSSYGAAAVTSPLLPRPLHGLVRLRESRRRLPDLVASVGGEVGLDLVGRVEALQGRIRVRFDDLPAAPFTSLHLSLAGGKRGLVVNAADLCRSPARATVVVTGQSGVRRVLRPRLAADCGVNAAAASAVK